MEDMDLVGLYKSEEILWNAQSIIGGTKGTIVGNSCR